MKPASGLLARFKSPQFSATGGPWRVNLGCGRCFHPDWVNIDFVSHHPDVIARDLRQTLPFPADCCEVIYHSHVLEHFPRSFAPVFLRECLRVLMPGGILRVVVPDLETIARLYLKHLDGALAGEETSAVRHEWMTLELLDQMVREESGGEMLRYWKQNPMPAGDFVVERLGSEVLQFITSHRAKARPSTTEDRKPPSAGSVARFRAGGEVHKWMYDRCSLRCLLASCGFAEITVCTASQSMIPGFSSYHLDVNEDGSVRKPDSLFMEARKPVNGKPS